MMEHWNQLPRAIRWATLFGLFMVLYFVLIEPIVIGRTMSMLGEASSLEARIVEAREQADDATLMAKVDEGMRSVGKVETPDSRAAREAAFNVAVDEILRRHDVDDHTSSFKASTVNRGPLADALEEGLALERSIRFVRFDASPTQVAAILADLERSPYVNNIPQVSLRRYEDRGRLVQASIGVETWVTVRKGRS